MYRYLFAAVVLLAGLTAYAAVTTAQTERTAIGTVERVAAEDGETSGWQIRLDDQLYLGDRLYDTIEIYDPDTDLFKYAGKRVAATGTFVQWRSPKRGKYIVLEICEIVVIE